MPHAVNAPPPPCRQGDSAPCRHMRTGLHQTVSISHCNSATEGGSVLGCTHTYTNTSSQRTRQQTHHPGLHQMLLKPLAPNHSLPSCLPTVNPVGPNVRPHPPLVRSPPPGHTPAGRISPGQADAADQDHCTATVLGTHTPTPAATSCCHRHPASAGAACCSYRLGRSCPQRLP